MKYTVHYNFNARWYILYLFIVGGVLTLGWFIFPKTIVADELFTILFSAIVYWTLSVTASFLVAIILIPVIIRIGPDRVSATIAVMVVALIMIFISCVVCLYITEYLIEPFEVVGLGPKIILAICFTAFTPRNKTKK